MCVCVCTSATTSHKNAWAGGCRSPELPPHGCDGGIIWDAHRLFSQPHPGGQIVSFPAQHAFTQCSASSFPCALVHCPSSNDIVFNQPMRLISCRLTVRAHRLHSCSSQRNGLATTLATDLHSSLKEAGAFVSVHFAAGSPVASAIVLACPTTRWRTSFETTSFAMELGLTSLLSLSCACTYS